MQAASRVFRASVVVVAVVPGSVKHMFVLLHNDSSRLLHFYRHLCCQASVSPLLTRSLPVICHIRPAALKLDAYLRL